MRRSHPSNLKSYFLILILLTAFVLLFVYAGSFSTPHSVTDYRFSTYIGATLFFSIVGLLTHTISRVLIIRPNNHLLTLSLTFLVLVITLNFYEIIIASDLLKVLLAITIGVFATKGIERASWLIPVALLAPLADLWSVFSSNGVTHAMIKRSVEQPAWINWPTIAIPALGLSYSEFGRIGSTDIMFLALFVASAIKWDLGIKRHAILLPLSFVLSIVIVNEWSSRPIPALPILCITFLLLFATNRFSFNRRNAT